MNDLETFLAMGGYAAFIWPAWGLSGRPWACLVGLGAVWTDLTIGELPGNYPGTTQDLAWLRWGVWPG